MGLVKNLLKHLENSIEKKDDGYIDLSKLTPAERENAFIQFGEGNEDLTRLLKIAYEHNVESMFCCSGHNGPNGYVVFKVNEDNLKYLQDVGKVLSNHGVITNFDNHYDKGKRVSYRGKNSSDWFGIAGDIMENIKDFDYNNPSIYYHEKMNESYIPLDYKIKKFLINLLQKMDKKESLPEAKAESTSISQSEFRDKLIIKPEDNKENITNMQKEADKETER